MSTPIYSRLEEYFREKRVSFAMPGHKQGRGLKADFICCDVTELDKTVNLRSDDDAVIGEAQKLLAQLYGSQESYILTGGSTAGIQAMLASALMPGDTVLVSGDCHMSVINTCALCGYKMKFIPATFDSQTFIAKDKENAADYIRHERKVDAVLVTSPNYYGMCRNIEEIAQVCHERDIPLLVDEAHGAHFIASEKLPESAIRCGADAVVNSAHKTLNALTGAAYLHINSRLLNKARLKQALMMFQTSSPSYPIAASADFARAQLEQTDEWDVLVEDCRELRRILEEHPFMNIVENDDPTRLVVNFSVFDTDGYEISARLSENYGIDVEMADIANIVLIITPSNTTEDLELLIKALDEIYSTLTIRREPISILPPPEHSEHIDPQTAFYSRSKLVSSANSFGKVSAATITAYPPGIPIICMGEEITAGHVGYIRHLMNMGAKFTGLVGESLPVI